MGNQPSKPSARTCRTTYQKMTFIIALAFLLLGGLALTFSPAWESLAPELAEAIQGKNVELLEAAAATALLLSLVWGRQTDSLASVAVIYGGVFAFAAAAFSLNLIGTNALPAKTGEPSVILPLALLFLISPLIIATLPMLKFSKNWAAWLVLLGHILYVFIAILLISISVNPLIQRVANAGILGLVGFLLTSLFLAILATLGITAVQCALHAGVQNTAGLARSRKGCCRIDTQKPKPPPRCKRRRSRRRCKRASCRTCCDGGNAAPCGTPAGRRRKLSFSVSWSTSSSCPRPPT